MHTHVSWSRLVFIQTAVICFQILDHLSMIENRNESELEAYLIRVVKHSNLSRQKSERGNEKSALRGVSHGVPVWALRC